MLFNSIDIQYVFINFIFLLAVKNIQENMNDMCVYRERRKMNVIKAPL